jgi:hypothetical protein
MAGSLIISGHSATEPAGERNFGPISIIGKAVGETLASPLQMGDNRFTIPTEMVAALIIPPTGVSAEIRVRTNSNESDAGLLISESNPTLYSLPATIPTVLIVHASAATATPISIAFV